MNTTTRLARPLALALLLAGTAALPALAEGYAQGDFTLGLGVHDVMPKDKPGKLAGADSDISDSLRPTITFEYFLRDNIGIEVLGALPFSHDVKLDGLGKVAKVKQLPPVISLQYYFANDSKFTPFVGAGINYTAFIEDKGAGALAGNDVDVKDSWGLALHGGVDYALDANNAVRLDARWIDINSKVYLNDTYIGKADISPWVFGAAWVHRF